jgi:alpha-tubulin suppressor-like RCC1 family protein
MDGSRRSPDHPLLHAIWLVAGVFLAACSGEEIAPGPSAALGEASSPLPEGPPPHRAQAITAGGLHACALLKTGALKCWGENGSGQLGIGDANDRGDGPGEMGAALTASFGGNITAIAAGALHTCALHRVPSSSEIVVKCWGNSAYGQIARPDGLGATGDQPGELWIGSYAVELADMSTSANAAKAVAAGDAHTCAIREDDKLKCWGHNQYGQLGLGDQNHRGDGESEMYGTPTIPLGAGRIAKAIALGGFHTCALLDDSTIKCWGRNDLRQLGLGDTLTRGATPGTVPASLPVVQLGIPGNGAKALAAGMYHTCAILSDDMVKCWGLNLHGETGQGHSATTGAMPNNTDPVPLGGPVKAIAAGAGHTCALLSSGAVKCWGANSYGQLGLGHQNPVGASPGQIEVVAAVDLGPGRTAKAISAGQSFTCALLDTDEVKCWGAAGSGALGHPGCSGVTPHCGDEPGEMGAALPVVDLGPDEISIGGCGSPAVVLHDTFLHEAAPDSFLCLYGAGRPLNLAEVPRGASGNWAGAVRSMEFDLPSGDPNQGVLLSRSVCEEVGCPSQHFTGVDTAGWINADPSGQTADLVTLYKLEKPPTAADMAPGVLRWTVTDHHLTSAEVADLVDTRTFVWDGDRNPAAWNADGVKALSGLYMPSAGLDDGALPPCLENDDCLLHGYRCRNVLGPEANYWDKVCRRDTPRACTTDAECNLAGIAEIPGACKDNVCQINVQAHRMIEYDYWNTTHPDWILYQCNPANPTATPPRTLANAAWAEGPGGNQLMLDFTNPAFVEEMLNRIHTRWPSANFDSLSLDAVYIANYRAACGVFAETWKPMFSARNGYNPTLCSPGASGCCNPVPNESCADPESEDCLVKDGYCDFRYTRAVTKLLKRMRDEMHKYGKRLHANLGYTGSLGPAYSIDHADPTLNDIFKTLDGVLDEGGFNYNMCGYLSYDGSYSCPSRGFTGQQASYWSNTHNYMLRVQEDSKPYYLKTGFVIPGAVAPTAAQIEWALASYSVSDRGLASLYVTIEKDPRGEWDHAQLRVDLGPPCEDAQVVYEPAGTKRKALVRRYRHGLVAVNFGEPPPSPAPGGGPVTVALPTMSIDDPDPAVAKYFAWNGSDAYDAPVTGASIVVPPLQGRVLVKQGAPLCE